MKTLLLVSLVGLMTLTSQAATNPPLLTASALLDKYTQALDSTRSFASTSESTNVLNSRVPSWGLQMSNALSFTRAEEKTDGRGRLYSKSLHWGHVDGSHQQLAETNAVYELNVVGDDFRYRDDKMLGQTTFKGQIHYNVKGGGEFNKNKSEWGYFVGDNMPGYFLGYMSAGRRLDEMLKGARSITVRQTTETINGAVCYVVEAVTKYGRFTVWLDSEHGYHPARIRASVRVGDDIGFPGSPHVITRQEAITRDYSVDDVRFEKVGDVWVPMEADAKRHVVLGNEHGFSDSTIHYKRTKIVLNPDHDALGSFADPMRNPALDPELVNGSTVYLDSVGKNAWQDGVVVDSNGSVVLDRRTKSWWNPSTW